MKFSAAVLALGLACLVVLTQARSIGEVEIPEPVEIDEVSKRFFLDDLGGLIDHFGKLTFAQLIEIFKNAEQKVVSILGSKANFLASLDKLKNMIHSDTTVSGCTKVCEAAANSILGSVLSVDAPQACKPLCNAALAQLEETAKGKK